MAVNPPGQSKPNAPLTGWQIEYQQETVGTGPDGKAAEGIKVGFVMANGVHASVFIPKSRFSVDNARAAVAAAAAQHAAVDKLTG